MAAPHTRSSAECQKGPVELPSIDLNFANSLSVLHSSKIAKIDLSQSLYLSNYWLIFIKKL